MAGIVQNDYSVFQKPSLKGRGFSRAETRT